MTGRRTKILEDLTTGPADRHGEVPHRVTAIEFHTGGRSMISGDWSERGYYLTVRDEKHGTSPSGIKTVSFLLFSGGVKSLLEPAKAFSAKKLAGLTAPPERIAALKAHLDRSAA